MDFATITLFHSELYNFDHSYPFLPKISGSPMTAAQYNKMLGGRPKPGET